MHLCKEVSWRKVAYHIKMVPGWGPKMRVSLDSILLTSTQRGSHLEKISVAHLRCVLLTLNYLDRELCTGRPEYLKMMKGFVKMTCSISIVLFI